MNWIKISALSLLILVVPLSGISCSGESDEAAKKKLEVILEDDLKVILEGIPDTALIEKPYYNLFSYKQYEKGNYSKKAEADFFFMKSVHVKIVRKYRYHRSKRMWERYYNEYGFISENADSAGNK